jgi:N-acetylglucosamine-6-phosphate deacetylase
MHAEAPELERLCRELAKAGVQAFLPTTLSCPPSLFEAALERLGSFIRKQWETAPQPHLAFPVGIHLEGPFLAQSCCGAHPPEFLIEPSLSQLQDWWHLSQKTLARITLAPERGDPREVEAILDWCKEHGISVSIGHSSATREQGRAWLSKGLHQLTHAWNAMPFHHRNPGLLGEFLGKKGAFIELIPDGVHLDPAVLRWTHALHPQGLFWVSDGVPAGGTSTSSSFGPLTIQCHPHEPVCRTLEGKLAGGALPLSKLALEVARKRWIHPRPSLFAHEIRSLCWETPWKALGQSPQRRRWKKTLEAQSRN